MRIIYCILIYLERYTILFVLLKTESRGISLFHFGVRAIAGMQKSEEGGGRKNVRLCSH